MGRLTGDGLLLRKVCRILSHNFFRSPRGTLGLNWTIKDGPGRAGIGGGRVAVGRLGATETMRFVMIINGTWLVDTIQSLFSG